MVKKDEQYNEQKRNGKNERTVMLSKVKTLKGYKLHSLDGEIGKVKDLYFDDRYWAIRYLVADSGNWLSGRQVLISPYALRAVNKEERNIAINLTKKQIEDSPPLDSDKPVSRQFEEDYHGYYGYVPYWYGPFMWGYYPYIERDRDIVREREERRRAEESAQAEREKWDPHLRSTNAVSGYHIQASDGEIGHIEDFIIDDEKWAIRYLIINAQNWWPGKEVLVSPKWTERISWNDSKIFINLTRETIKQSPEYTETSPLTRDYEIGLHKHYNRQGYWVE
jgi:sporulation protein YlmC with PRC-barrel domain